MCLGCPRAKKIPPGPRNCKTEKVMVRHDVKFSGRTCRNHLETCGLWNKPSTEESQFKKLSKAEMLRCVQLAYLGCGAIFALQMRQITVLFRCLTCPEWFCDALCGRISCLKEKQRRDGYSMSYIHLQVQPCFKSGLWWFLLHAMKAIQSLMCREPASAATELMAPIKPHRWVRDSCGANSSGKLSDDPPRITPRHTSSQPFSSNVENLHFQQRKQFSQCSTKCVWVF